MSTVTVPPAAEVIIYPEDDGQPMSDNTLQFQWIVTIACGLQAVFRDDPNVFVAGNLLWYPVEGEITIRQAPDVLVAFNRPKGYRGSYKQWEEGGIAPQVVWEVRSPGNRFSEMLHKFQFYERYGVEEYYIYDPHWGTLDGWLRQGDKLIEIPSMNGWVSPRLGVRFELAEDGLRLYGPDGRRFLTYVELAAQWDRERQDKEQAQREKEQAQREKEQAQREKEQAQREKEQAQREKERLAAQLRALGVEPEV